MIKFDIEIPAEDSFLAQYVTMLWEVKGGSKYSERILPKGIIELLFNLDRPVHAAYPGHRAPVTLKTCAIQGIQTQAFKTNYTGNHHLFGVRIKPYMLKSFLGISPSEISNRAIDLTLVKPYMLGIWHRLAESVSFRKRVECIENILRPVPTSGCTRSQYLSNLFTDDNLQPFQSVDYLATRVCYSTRQLNRKTHEIFGIPAEELIRYKKFMHSCLLIHLSEYPLTDIAYRSGFYDQSHFNRVFKSYSDINPKEYRNNKSSLPFHLFK